MERITVDLQIAGQGDAHCAVAAVTGIDGWQRCRDSGGIPVPGFRDSH